MEAVLLGGAPGVGKSTLAQELLRLASAGARLVQWVDVDHLWLHQPWRVDEATKRMVQGNLKAVLANSRRASVDIVIVTWVFQDVEMHRLVRTLMPSGTEVITIQLHASPTCWRDRFAKDPGRPHVDEFFEMRYSAAQRTPVDHVIDTDGRGPLELANTVAGIIGL